MKIRKTSTNTPDTDEGLILMNARRKEKKERNKNKSKPRNTSEWLSLGTDLKKWFDEHNEENSFISGLHKQNLTWSQIKAWRSESEDFNNAVAYCLQLCQTRREQYLEKEGKLASIYLREHPLYVPMLGDYEKELKEKGESLSETQKQLHEEIVKKILGK